MIYNEGTRKALDSFLQNAPRPYVLNSDRLPKEMNELYQRIHHLAFLLCLRLATYKESKVRYFSPAVDAYKIVTYMVTWLWSHRFAFS